MVEAIKLHNIAGNCSTVIACLAQALGDSFSLTNESGDKGKNVEDIAREIYHSYSRLNRVPGKERDAVSILLRIRDAMHAKVSGNLDEAFEV